MNKAEELLQLIQQAGLQLCDPQKVQHSDPMKVYRWRTKRYVITKDSNIILRGSFFRFKNIGNTISDVTDHAYLMPNSVDWSGSPVPNSVHDEECKTTVCFGKKNEACKPLLDDNGEIVCENGVPIIAPPNNCLLITAQYWDHPDIKSAIGNKPLVEIC